MRCEDRKEGEREGERRGIGRIEKGGEKAWGGGRHTFSALFVVFT